MRAANILTHGTLIMKGRPQGVRPARAVLTVPLFFGLAHLHHLHELVVHQGAPLQDAAVMVRSSAGQRRT